MPAKSMRYVAAGIVLLATAAIGHAQVAPSAIAYRDAVRVYVKTGEPAIGIKPMLGWDRTALEAVIAETIASGDAALIEAASVMHLEIGVAIAGLSTASAHGHFELGTLLVDSLLPVKPEDRRNLSAARIEEVTLIRATYLGVAGSAFLSVNDIMRARTFFARALKIAPKSPAILTLQGSADELEGGALNPEDVESPTMRARAARERHRLLLRAEERYRDALEADPNYPLAQIRLGRVQHLLNERKAAAEWLAKGSAAATEPSHRYLAAMFTGALQQDQKDLAGARKSFERALTVSPRSQNATVALAYVELLSGRPDHAQALARSYTGTPNSDDGWWAYKSGSLDSVGLQWMRRRVRK